MFYKQFQNFDPMASYVPSAPFALLPEIANRARTLLRNRDQEQIIIIAKRIDHLVESHLCDLKDMAIIDLKKKYDPDDDEFSRYFEWDGGTRENGRYLFNESMLDELGILTQDNASSVDVLKSVIDERDDHFYLPEGVPEPASDEYAEGRDYEFFAVLSLWLLADALSFLTNRANNPTCLSVAGSYAIEAMNSVCYAEHLKESEWLIAYTQKTGDAKLANALKQEKENRKIMLSLARKRDAERDKKEKSEKGKKAAEAKHNRVGGSREKRNKILAAWASGKYSSKDICTEQESASLDMSFATARKALREPRLPKST